MFRLALGWAGYFFFGDVWGLLALSLARGRGLGPGWGALGPALEVGVPGFPSQLSPVSPPPAGRDGEELRASPPRGGAGAGQERTGRGGPGTRGGAGPHTGRGGWLGPLRSRWRLEEEARRLKRRGGRGGRGWSAVRRRLTSPAQQGKVWRARFPLLAPGSRFSLRAGGGCGRRGRAKGPERPGRWGLCGAPATRALRREGWVRGIPRGSRRAVGAAPPSPASGEAAVGVGGR